MNLLLRCCSECENAAKELALTFSGVTSNQVYAGNKNFSQIGLLITRQILLHLKEVEIVWPHQDLSQVVIKPFSRWKPNNCKNPTWFDAYNVVKHGRNQNIQKCNYGNLIKALTGLFMLNLYLKKSDLEGSNGWVASDKELISLSEFFSPKRLLKKTGTVRSFGSGTPKYIFKI